MAPSNLLELPEPWKHIYSERREAIRVRLNDYSSVPKDEHFYELLFCVLTPQSSARNADATIKKLKAERFRETGFDPTHILRDPSHYIRFHNTKAKRLLAIRDIFPDLESILYAEYPTNIHLRNTLRVAVPGFGLKESSHFLRNIGFRDLAILDRHILKHLIQLRIISRIPTSLTDKKYFTIEKKWKKYATSIGISIDELDLLFWSMETGEILK